MDLHTAIKGILKRRGKSQTQLSEELGYSQNTVLNNLLVNGNPRLSTLIRICKALDCKLMIREDTKYIELTLEESER